MDKKQDLLKTLKKSPDEFMLLLQTGYEEDPGISKQTLNRVLVEWMRGLSVP